MASEAAEKIVQFYLTREGQSPFADWLLLGGDKSSQAKDIQQAQDGSTDLVAALLGILKCGAAFVPMDASIPSDRLQQSSNGQKRPL